eukprot:6589472-Pyramimonas_sp.AAC.1
MPRYELWRTGCMVSGHCSQDWAFPRCNLQTPVSVALRKRGGGGARARGQHATGHFTASA